VERGAADPVQVGNAVENRRQVERERYLRAFFERLQQRFPVRILDHDLKITELPSLTDSQRERP